MILPKPRMLDTCQYNCASAWGEREIFEVLLHVAQVTNKLKSMSHTTQQLLQEVLQRLETDHGVDLVSTTLSLLICTRDGTYQLLPFLSLGYI